MSRFAIPAAHADQVVHLPAAARVVASSPRCPIAAVTYTNRRALSFQGHPEFPLDYAALLVDRFERCGAISAADAHEARRSLRLTDDRASVARWIRQFIESE
jgi:GMP synthase-like glutamine amidotransferase